MTTWKKVSEQLHAALGLDSPPVAVSFLSSPPEGVRKFLGQAPSSCSFWKLAATAPAGKSAFYTVAGDHYNCPIGSYTHQIELPTERAHELSDVLGLMSKIGYVDMAEVPSIPRWPVAPAAVVYARLEDAPVAPDVVVFALSARSAMLLGEAGRAAGVNAATEPLFRPTCMALPAAAAKGATTSLGCVGNRIYTGLDEGQLYTVVRGSDLEKLAAALTSILSANAALTSYHTDRKAQLTRS